MVVQEIPIDLLVPHPENANHMTTEALRKLQNHVARSGRYEPLVVRPHPELAGRYQLLNGHHRLRVLKALGHNSVRCVVWDVGDDQARLYLATLNRLSGTDIPERRATLIENLLGTFDLGELEALLPDDRRQIEEIERLARVQGGKVEASADALRARTELPVILDFVVDQEGSRRIHLALDMFRAGKGAPISNSEALIGLAGFFLERCMPS
jgi:hypothetical protein